MGIINKLPIEISNKIAAGEVVERPASVIKELVENAIDAGADVINIEIRKGGIAYIRVTDNGCGMERSDAETAFERHATSKIHSERDLDAIYTLGFRGEALSSIGAVSQVDLFTKRACDSEGTHVIHTGGVTEVSSDVGIPDGTTFVVNKLFFNTPARMNFLKRDASEAAAITDIVERFILARPEISFRYTIDGKEKYFTAGDNSLINCIYAVYGKNYAKSVIPVDYEDETVKITGMIGKGDAARPNRGYQSFFVNHRYVKSLKISGAVEAAYKNQIMIGKHPVAVLNIEINPKHTDINVHPTKLEVKFAREEEIMRAIYHSVQNSLYALPNVPQIERTAAVQNEFARDESTTAQQIKIETSEIIQSAQEIRETREEKPVNFAENSKPAEPRDADKESQNSENNKPDKIKPAEAESYERNTSREYFIKKQNKIVESWEPVPEILEQKFSEPHNDTAKIDELLSGIESAPKAEIKENKPLNEWGFERSHMRVIGQVFDTYILAQADDIMIIADQHAAHERLKYEELKKALAEREITPQVLLVPIVIELSAVEFAVYAENAERFAEMGFELEDFGDNCLLARAVPEPMEKEELQVLVIELIGRMSEGHEEVMSEKMERALYTIACKAAVKANTRFDNKQLEDLLNRILDLKNINTCPHGRPIIVTMSKKELEKEFKRIL